MPQKHPSSKKRRSDRSAKRSNTKLKRSKGNTSKSGFKGDSKASASKTGASKSNISKNSASKSSATNGSSKRRTARKTDAPVGVKQGLRQDSKPGKGRSSGSAANSKGKEGELKSPSRSEGNVHNPKAYFVEVDAEHAGQRVDNFLVTHLKKVPKAHIYRIIRKGEVRVNKGRVKQTSRLSEGDLIRIPPIRLPEVHAADVDASRYAFLQKTILLEDDALLIINKPSGMAVHAGSGINVGVIEALRALRTDIKYLELVHRLDRETSGCLVLAKKSSALKILHEDFKTNSLKNKRLDKRYMALVKGHWKYGQRQVTKALNTDARKHGERFVVVDEQGRYASSIVVPVDVSSLASLVEVKLLTGRTHQVRVHTQSEGHPIAGDSKYGDPDFNKQAKNFNLKRLFLHASKLTFTHPISGDSTTVEAPLPKDLEQVLHSFKLCINS